MDQNEAKRWAVRLDVAGGPEVKVSWANLRRWQQVNTKRRAYLYARGWVLGWVQNGAFTRAEGL